MFIEINLRKTKLLFFGSYRSNHPDYGLGEEYYFEQLTLALDVYSSYDKVLLAGDFNAKEENQFLKHFLIEHDSKKLGEGDDML